jgi:alkylhydroperoxidase family enzyme
MSKATGTGRVALLDPREGTGLQLATRIRAERGGKLLNLYRTLLHSPAFAEGWLSLLSAVRNHSSLPDSLRELIILRVAQLNDAPYEYAVHLPIGLEAGLIQSQVDTLENWRESNEFSPSERAVLQLTDVMTREVKVSDAIYQAVSAHFSDQEMVEMAVTISAYNMVSRFLEAMQIEHDQP